MSHHALKLRLIKRLHELTGKLTEIEDALEEPHSRDWAEMAVEREDEEVLERLGENGMVELASIRSALTRMSEGEYGFCVQCGEEIAPARLEAVPATPLCVKCAAR
jgi:RNA polymerase-binding transcription factor DksA